MAPRETGNLITKACVGIMAFIICPEMFTHGFVSSPCYVRIYSIPIVACENINLVCMSRLAVRSISKVGHRLVAFIVSVVIGIPISNRAHRVEIGILD